jgi:hypothetical protein
MEKLKLSRLSQLLFPLFPDELSNLSPRLSESTSYFIAGVKPSLLITYSYGDFKEILFILKNSSC